MDERALGLELGELGGADEDPGIGVFGVGEYSRDEESAADDQTAPGPAPDVAQEGPPRWARGCRGLVQQPPPFLISRLTLTALISMGLTAILAPVKWAWRAPCRR